MRGPPLNLVRFFVFKALTLLFHKDRTLTGCQVAFDETGLVVRIGEGYFKVEISKADGRVVRNLFHK